jgi:hypothetical protein
MVNKLIKKIIMGCGCKNKNGASTTSTTTTSTSCTKYFGSGKC